MIKNAVHTGLATFAVGVIHGSLLAPLHAFYHQSGIGMIESGLPWQIIHLHVHRGHGEFTIQELKQQMHVGHVVDTGHGVYADTMAQTLHEMRIVNDLLPSAAPSPVIIDQIKAIDAETEIGVGKMRYQMQKISAEFHTIGAHGQEKICAVSGYATPHELAYFGHDGGFAALEIHRTATVQFVYVYARQVIVVWCGAVHLAWSWIHGSGRFDFELAILDFDGLALRRRTSPTLDVAIIAGMHFVEARMCDFVELIRVFKFQLDHPVKGLELSVALDALLFVLVADSTVFGQFVTSQHGLANADIIRIMPPVLDVIDVGHGTAVSGTQARKIAVIVQIDPGVDTETGVLGIHKIDPVQDPGSIAVVTENSAFT